MIPSIAIKYWSFSNKSIKPKDRTKTDTTTSGHSGPESKGIEKVTSHLLRPQNFSLTTKSNRFRTQFVDFISFDDNSDITLLIIGNSF